MENSKIEWTDHTFNPWIGCTKVSAGCKNCYAEAFMDKRLKRAKWGAQGTRVRTTEQYWKKPLAWNKKAEKAGVRQRVFCASLADVFEDHPAQREEMAQWRTDLFNLISETPWLDWLLLAKRPGNVLAMVPDHWLDQWPSLIADSDELWHIETMSGFGGNGYAKALISQAGITYAWEVCTDEGAALMDSLGIDFDDAR